MAAAVATDRNLSQASCLAGWAPCIPLFPQHRLFRLFPKDLGCCCSAGSWAAPSTGLLVPASCNPGPRIMLCTHAPSLPKVLTANIFELKLCFDGVCAFYLKNTGLPQTVFSPGCWVEPQGICQSKQGSCVKGALGSAWMTRHGTSTKLKYPERH